MSVGICIILLKFIYFPAYKVFIVQLGKLSARCTTEKKNNNTKHLNTALSRDFSGKQLIKGILNMFIEQLCANKENHKKQHAKVYICPKKLLQHSHTSFQT